MGEIRINLSNFVSIGLLAFVFVWAANRILSKIGYSQYQA